MSDEKYSDNDIAVLDKDGSVIYPDYEEDVIKKANQIITGKHKISALEQKVFNLSLAKVKYDKKLNRPVAELTVKEIKKIIGCKGNSIYTYIKDIADSLSDRKIILEDKEKQEFEIVGLMNIVKYKRGKLTIMFEPEITKFVLNLQSNYTRLNLKLYSKLNNIYAMRLYEIFKSKLFKEINSFSIAYGINDLKLTIGMIQTNKEINNAIKKGMSTEVAVAKYYKGNELGFTGNFTRALETAINEINEITDIYVEYESIKVSNGGKIDKILFNIMDKTLLQNINVDIKGIQQNKPSEDEMLEMIVELKINIEEKLTIENYKQLLECANYNVELILEKYEQSKKTKKIDNLVAWLTCAIKENYKTTSKNNTSESSSNQSDKPKNKFNDFQQRNYSDDEIADLEKKLLNK